jgi:hypothetical protein
MKIESVLAVATATLATVSSSSGVRGCVARR